MLPLLLACADYGFQVENRTTIAGEFHTLQNEVQGQPRLDILWAFDTSCSMDHERNILTATMPAVFDVLSHELGDSISWRAGITATDPTAGIFGSVDSDDHLADERLRTLPALIDFDFEGEAGLDALYTSMVWDDQFHRPDSSLLNIVISDEDHQGVESASSYLDLTRRFKSEPYQVDTVAIVVTESGSVAGCGGDIGAEYMTASDKTIPLCHPAQWAEMLEPARASVPEAAGLRYELRPPPTEPAHEHVWAYADGAPVAYTYERGVVTIDDDLDPGTWIVVNWESDPI